ncbi:MAG: tRNA epoxyqueuosine(34) reductase QueG [Flavobacteriaceae bacterium]|nr:tRNA epoxyqueuosine(34) reductase QueG [Flavobacteriaceae bacterium]
MEPKSHSERIKKRALELGFLDCGIAKADFLEDEAPRLEAYLNENRHGKMAYMENHFDMRLDPRLLVEGAKSVISLTYNYFPNKFQQNDSYKIAKYAYGTDYHFVVKDKLRELLNFIQEEIGEVSGRAFVDSAPILEHAWAQKAGIGWVGKNSLTLSKQKGSFFFLSELILDLELDCDEAFKTDHCGSCSKCVEACPTDAILPDRKIDGSKCISYFTIELKDAIPSEMKGKFEDWIFGCDICQDVCPWNRFSIPHTEEKFRPKEELLNFSKSDWEEITEEVFRKVFQKSPVKRTKFEGLKRNIDFVSQNS